MSTISKEGKFSPTFCDFEWKSELEKCFKLIENHYFNHLVFVVLPNTVSVPSWITESISEDSVYYRVTAVNIFEILEQEFIEAFVKRGELSMLNDKARVDVEDCVCVTPTGHLVLNLQRETYQELGLEGKLDCFSIGKLPSKHIVRINLKANDFNILKKRYLQQNQKFKLDLLIAWDPPDESICPSTVAAYLHSKGYDVNACKTPFSQKLEYNVLVPEMNEYCCPEDVVEWLGTFSLNADIKLHPSDDFVNYVTSYLIPEPAKLCEQVTKLQWTGYFTRGKIFKLFKSLMNYSSRKQDLPWISMYVQGFIDSPVNGGLREHNVFKDGENEYTIFFQSDKFLVCSKT